MANIVTCCEREDLFIQMSNGLTSVFISVLTLSGAELAETHSEKGLIIWLAQRDQSVFGGGCVSFDVTEMCWTKDHFDEQKAFLLKTIDGALSRSNWEKLDYQPREEWVFTRLNDFKTLINEFRVEDLRENVESGILSFHSNIQRYDNCPIHGVYLHAEGCVVCNDK